MALSVCHSTSVFIHISTSLYFSFHPKQSKQPAALQSRGLLEVSAPVFSWLLLCHVCSEGIGWFLIVQSASQRLRLSFSTL